MIFSMIKILIEFHTADFIIDVPRTYVRRYSMSSLQDSGFIMRCVEIKNDFNLQGLVKY